MERDGYAHGAGGLDSGFSHLLCAVHHQCPSCEVWIKVEKVGKADERNQKKKAFVLAFPLKHQQDLRQVILSCWGC